MKNLLSIFLATAFVLGMSSTSSAKVKVTKGDLGFLKNVKELKVEFDYSSMSVGKYATEQEYIDKKTGEIAEKNPADADAWLEGWVANRDNRFEPKFTELFNEICDGALTVSEESTSGFRVVVKTVRTEPGFNIGVTKKAASCDFILEFYEDGSDTPSAIVEIFGVPGSQVMGYDLDAGSRLAECYALCGKQMAKYIQKNVFK